MDFGWFLLSFDDDALEYLFKTLFSRFLLLSGDGSLQYISEDGLGNMKLDFGILHFSIELSFVNFASEIEMTHQFIFLTAITSSEMQRRRKLKKPNI